MEGAERHERLAAAYAEAGDFDAAVRVAVEGDRAPERREAEGRLPHSADSLP